MLPTMPRIWNKYDLLPGTGAGALRNGTAATWWQAPFASFPSAGVVYLGCRLSKLLYLFIPMVNLWPFKWSWMLITGGKCLFGRHLAKKPTNPPTSPLPNYHRKIWKCQMICLETMNSPGALMSVLQSNWSSNEKKEKDCLPPDTWYLAAFNRALSQAAMSCHLTSVCRHQTHPDRPLTTQRPFIHNSRKRNFFVYSDQRYSHS